MESNERSEVAIYANLSEFFRFIIPASRLYSRDGG